MSGLAKFALRDVSFLIATLGVWGLEASMRGAGSVSSTVFGLAAGLMAAVCGFFAHEWGHLSGALLSGSVVHIPGSAGSLFLFNFDSDRNGRNQFVAMSFGGFIASALVIALFVTVLPLDALSGRVAMGITLLGVLATVTLEFPPVFRVARGAPLPRGGVYKSLPAKSS